jgi:hypothetical protein
MRALQELLRSKGYNVEIDGIVGTETLAATHSFIFREISKRRWTMPLTDFVWLRLDNKLTNTYDDICVRYNKGVIDMIFPCTTTAGDYYIFNPLTVGGITGTAVAAEQQVLNSHKFVTSANWKTLWLGQPYFQQISPIAYYRDGNKDRNIDKNKLYSGLIGDNWHHGGAENFINNWSAACFVTQPIHWLKAINIFKDGDIKTLTLIETFNGY